VLGITIEILAAPDFWAAPSVVRATLLAGLAVYDEVPRTNLVKLSHFSFVCGPAVACHNSSLFRTPRPPSTTQLDKVAGHVSGGRDNDIAFLIGWV
jgi:hypothetical protein